MPASDIVLKAPNQSAGAGNGVTYAYRRFGAASPGVLPLVMLQHFRGNLDDWDPLLLGALASGREVIVVDNAGVGLSSVPFPRTIAEMGRDVIAFTDALGLPRIDLLGFSIGGMIAQELALLRPQLVRRLVLAGTGPQGGLLMHGWISDVAYLANVAASHLEDQLTGFFLIRTESALESWPVVWPGAGAAASTYQPLDVG